METMKTFTRSTTGFGRMREFLQSRGLALDDEAIERNYIAVSEAFRAWETCKACPGRGGCPLDAPGLIPELRLEDDGHVSVYYIRCPKDEAYKRMKRIESLMHSSRLPEHFRNKTFETFTVMPGNHEAFEAARRVALDEGGRGLVLAGSTGVGKTHLAAAILNARICSGREAVFCTVPELLADIRRTVRNERETSELLEIVKDAELLVLDDLGAERTTEWVTEQLFVVINARLLRTRQTVVTTNFTSLPTLIEKLGGLAGQRIVSRLCEMCDWVRIEGRDWRLRKEA